MNSHSKFNKLDFKTIIIYISDWIILLPLVLGAACFLRLRFDSRLILAVVIAGAIPQMIHFYLTKSTAQTITYNLYSPLEFIIFFLIFYNKASGRHIKRFYLLTCLLTILTASYLVFSYGISNRFLNEWTLVNNVCYLFWIGLYIYETFYFDKNDLTIKSPSFWYVIGILMYAACTTVVYSLWQRISNSPKDSVLKYLWTVQNIFNIILYFFFTIGLWVDIKFRNR